MRNSDFSQFMIAGTNSGSGKTTVTLGILRALTRRALNVAPFKCGPDYIDPLFHRQAAGRVSYNLDTFFGSDRSYARYASGADAAVTEGVMGLFDGRSDDAGSSAELAAKLHLPVLLTVNAKGLSQSIAPLVKGFADWNPNVKIMGVIANNIGSVRHAELLKSALEKQGLPPLTGYLLRNEKWTLPERHLGLSVGTLDSKWLDELAEEVGRTVDLDGVLARSRAVRPAWTPIEKPPVRFRLGVARDEAFCFYYEENFDLLRENGVECVFFSPLAEKSPPDNLNALYFGGGFPELYADRLAGNRDMLDAVRNFARNGKFVCGECGGYLYLLESLTGFDGATFPMCGLLPGRAVMHSTLSALGYRTVQSPFGEIRGHEFHYSSAEEPGPRLWTSCSDLRGRTFASGGIRGTVSGSYVHLHFASNPNALKKIIGELS